MRLKINTKIILTLLITNLKDLKDFSRFFFKFGNCAREVNENPIKTLVRIKKVCFMVNRILCTPKNNTVWVW